MAAASPELTLIDRAVAWIAPRAGIKRLQARVALAYYEAAKPSRQRKWRQTSGAPDQLVGTSAVAIRNQIRFLERNHDIARGALAVLVNNTVGPSGIGVEFQPRRANGSIHEAYQQALTDAYRDWALRPEVTWQHGWPATQRMAAKTLYRDGEVFAQRIMGRLEKLDHGTRVPYSLELIEPDLVPHDYDDEARGIRQGIERSAFGRAVAYHCYKVHPEDSTKAGVQRDTKRVPADRMLHAALRDRIAQLRGVSAFASVINRLEDIKDYEESERIAAKVAAMLTGFVKRAAGPEGFDPAGLELDESGNLKPRDLRMAPGMIIDTLAVGEEIGLIDSSRPNPNLVQFRDGQLRALAAGINASYSSISRNYNGTFSAQRQELVEQWVNYAVLTDNFTSGFVRPPIEDFVTAADMSGVVPMPRDLKPGTWNDFLFIAPAMPWIDPMKEAMAWLTLVQAGFASEYEVMRKRGVNPHDMLEQVVAWRKAANGAGLKFKSDYANEKPDAVAAAAGDDNAGAQT